MLYQKQQRAGEGGSPVRVKFSRRSLRSFISEKPAFGGSRKRRLSPVTGNMYRQQCPYSVTGGTANDFVLLRMGAFFVIKVPDIGRADPQAQEGAKPRSGNVGGDRGSDQLL